jgi:hypothetical protein
MKTPSDAAQCRPARQKQLQEPLDAVFVGQLLVHCRDAGRCAIVTAIKYRGDVLLVKPLRGHRAHKHRAARQTIRCCRNERSAGYARQCREKGRGWQYARPPATRHRDTWLPLDI